MTQDHRPDPDVLLARLRSEEEKESHGRLKVFFGACPGVGKTYSMLEDAQVRRREGVDVVVGIVETHGRAETEQLLSGLETLPRREVAYRGIALREFDLDAALKRRPALLLLDELAHTNAPGSRHAQRWQDALELLDAGIDVYTTMNVQHVESLNDVVAQVTGVVQRETAPDSILERSDEIVLVDLPPEELLKRLAEGKVYIPEQAQRAAQKYFRKSNLVALRELSLRFMANRVNVEVLAARRDATLDRIWPTRERLLVCVGPSPSSAKLIRSARRMATLLQAEWIALTVETPATASMSAQARERMANHQRLAQRLGAEVVAISGERMAEEVVRYARSRNVTKIVVGKPVLPWWRERLTNTVVDQIVRLSGDIDIYVIRGEGEPAHALPRRAADGAVAWRGYGGAFLGVAFCTAVDWLLFPYFALTDLTMVYLVGVMLTAMRGRRGPSILASVLSVLLFDFFFVPPRFTFAVSDLSYVVTFFVMLGAALLISTLMLRIRRQVETARLAALRLTAQHRLSSQLVESRGVEHLLGASARVIAEAAECRLAILLPDEAGQIRLRVVYPVEWRLSEKERGVAQWVYEHSQLAGWGTETLASAEALYVPLRASRETLGVLGVLRQDSPPAMDFIRLLEAFAAQVALALEVERLEEEQRRSLLQIEAERLRSSILSSVSHDLRTPLATILGSSGSLLDAWATLDDATRRALIADIHEEAERLSRLIANLLEMTRLEGGALELRREPQPLEEIVGAALSALDKRLRGRALETRLPDDLPLVEVDGLLVQHVLINLIENALNYAPADRPIRVEGRAVERGVEVLVEDFGPGLAPGEEDAVFEKFYRGKNSARTPGSGLGLAICRGIIEAHGGRISAANRPEGGALFRFTLPTYQGALKLEGEGESLA
ncbi:MAG: sensor histidine kinase KdpD, partial [Candidatus Sumerlaeota bacterium]|nr:sensor histidine kinase KdpD [Candidatus Sumerlaeota bacterium]